MTFRHLRSFLCLAILGYCASPASAAVVYNFDNSGDSAGWSVNASSTAIAGRYDATWGYNYGALGIPPAPGNAPGDTFGLRLRANLPATWQSPPVANNGTARAGTTSGISVSPTGADFGENFGMTFYVWANFHGAANATGLADNVNSPGGTHNTSFSIGTSGTAAQVIGNGAGLDTIHSMTFSATGDGGITADYGVFAGSNTLVNPATNPGVYAAGNVAGSTSNLDPFYTGLFGANSAPATQTGMIDGYDVTSAMAGNAQAGSFGFAWRKVTIEKYNGIVTWEVNDTLVATYNASSLTLGGNNIAFGQSDVNTSTTIYPTLVFSVYDNLTVYEIPEPASLSLIALGMCAIGFTARRRGA